DLLRRSECWSSGGVFSRQGCVSRNSRYSAGEDYHRGRLAKVFNALPAVGLDPVSCEQLAQVDLGVLVGDVFRVDARVDGGWVDVCNKLHNGVCIGYVKVVLIKNKIGFKVPLRAS
ncbi:MAG: hypothetical protein RJB39_761, partial [Candidatus Parcubacteria bacterium]